MTRRSAGAAAAPEQLAREQAELAAETGSAEEGAARFASEYLVDFDAVAPGAYYASLVGEAERAGRIGRTPYDPLGTSGSMTTPRSGSSSRLGARCG